MKVDAVEVLIDEMAVCVGGATVEEMLFELVASWAGVSGWF